MSNEGLIARARPMWCSFLTVTVVLGALACSESSTAPARQQTQTSQVVVARIHCMANTQSAKMSCVGADSASAARLPRLGGLGPSADLIMGGQNTFVTLASSNVAYAGDVFSFDVTVQNLIGQQLGTTDSTTLAPTGVRVFFDSPPVVTSGTGTIDFVDPVGGGPLVTGYSTFTQSNQAYYEYDQILAPSQTSDPLQWSIHVPSTVGSFEFSVFVSAPVQFPTGYIAVTPPSATLAAADTETLAAVVYDAEGRVLSSEVVTWATSDSTIATVDPATGIVTGIADGTATITATSTTRAATVTITVCGLCASPSLLSSLETDTRR